VRIFSVKKASYTAYFVLSRAVVAVKIQYLVSVRLLTVDLCVNRAAPVKKKDL
jgi:hypothetical protein